MTGHFKCRIFKERQTDKYESIKIMISIFWFLRGIQLLKYLPEGQLFIEEIIQEIAQNQYAQDAKRNKKLFLLAF